MAINDTNKTTEGFWCNLAAESIYNSPEKRSKSIDSLQAIITWAFGLFAVGGYISTVFGAFKSFELLTLLLFGLAFFCLTIAYSQAASAKYPVQQSFNPLDPVAILKASSAATKTQTKLFKVASILTSVGFFLLAIGILIQFSQTKEKKPAQTMISGQLAIKTGVIKIGDSAYVPVTVQWKKNEAVRLSYVDDTPTKKTLTDKANKTLLNQVFYTDTTGRLFYSKLFLKSDSITALTVRISAVQSAIADTQTEQITSVRLKLEK